MTPSPRPHDPAERGLALLLVFLLVLILIPFAAEFAMQVNYEARTAQNVTDQTVIENLIDGQFEAVLARIRRDAKSEQKVDSYADEWNAEEMRERREEDLQQDLVVTLSTRVFDEQGKFNLRLLAQGTDDRKKANRERLRRLLVEYRRDTSFELSDGDAETWAELIYDYLNGQRAANLPSPKTIDARPIHVLEEIGFLDAPRDRGVDWLLHDQRREEEVAPGLHRFVTVYGSGKLNLNTADVRVLRAYFHKDPEIAERIVERREGKTEEEGPRSSRDEEKQEESEDTGNPFTDVGQINEIEGVSPQSLQANGVDPAVDFDVRTSYFSIRIVGATDLTRRDELFVVERVLGQGQGGQGTQTVEGFRFHLHQERTDALEEIEEEER